MNVEVSLFKNGVVLGGVKFYVQSGDFKVKGSIDFDLVSVSGFAHKPCFYSMSLENTDIITTHYIVKDFDFLFFEYGDEKKNFIIHVGLTA